MIPRGHIRAPEGRELGPKNVLCCASVPLEGCGAYCEEFTEGHTFDLRDGREIAIVPVTMTLEPMRNAAQTKGSYFYDKIRTPIAPSIQQDNDRTGFSIRAFEMAVSAGEINLVTSGASLVGTWESKDHEKQYPLILQ